MIKGVGIDIGSTTVKLVAIDEKNNMVFKYMEQTKPRIKEQIGEILEKVEKQNPEIKSAPLVATGYGRKLAEKADKAITEITCHAKGIFHSFGHGGTLIDIGGQDSKVIVIGEKGNVLDFTMNDKCSAGTGRFLENTAARMEIPVEKIGELALSSPKEARISSVCTVFAESEIISLLAYGEKVEAVLKGLHRSLVSRIVGMINSVAFTPPLMLSGGVVKNIAIRKMLEEETGRQILLPEYPQFIGAYGASIYASLL